MIKKENQQSNEKTFFTPATKAQERLKKQAAALRKNLLRRKYQKRLIKVRQQK